MSWLDWLVCGGFLAYVVWDGVRRRGSATSLEGYFAGSRAIPWWAAGLSIMATQASAITVIGTTGQGFEQGMAFVQMYFGLPLAMVLLCLFFVPYLRACNVLTPYQLLEARFGPATRTLASLLFLISRCLALGVVIYAPAVVLSAMLGLPTWVSTLLIGGLTTSYTLLGGVAAVVWTDVKQMLVIVLGLLATAWLLLADLLPHYSFGQLLELAGASGRLNAVEVVPAHASLWPRTLQDASHDLGPASFWEEKYNLWSGLLGGLFLHLAYFGCDHSQAQRLLVGKDQEQSRKSLLLSAALKIPMQAGILLLGVLLWLVQASQQEPLLHNPAQRAIAQAQPALLAAIEPRFASALQARRDSLRAVTNAADAAAKAQAVAALQRADRDVQDLREQARRAVGGGKDTNDVFCRFVLDRFPPLLLGLVIAAIFAAAMSSIDSVLNALSAATVVDFYCRWLRPAASERHAVRVGQWVTLFWGAIATLSALFFAGGGSVIETINRIGSYFYGSLLGIFALAILMPRAGSRAGFLGLCGGMLLVLVVATTLQVEFLWFNLVGLLGVLGTGWLVQKFSPSGT